MSSTPNYKARIQRAVRNAVPVYSVFDSFRRFKYFTIFLIIIFPIYPSLAAIGTISETSIGDYDESSILASFTDTDELTNISETGLVTVNSNDSEVEENIPEKSSIPVPASNIKTYTVQEYDDVIKISKKYNVSAEVILWSNNLSMSDTLKVGQILKIPPVSGVVHILKPRETVSDLAKKYNVSTKEILEFNNISDATRIPDGAKLMIPGAVIREEPKVPEKPKITESKKAETPKQPEKTKTPETPKPTKTTPEPKKEEPKVETTSSQANDSVARYPIKFTGLGRGFAPGNCTWHVARHKNVTWRGNANQWIKNARAKGVPTGKTPAIGAIIQFSGHGYNSYYGHVGFVTDVTDTHVIVSDMNYKGLYNVTIRKVAKNDPAIDGYIYAN